MKRKWLRVIEYEEKGRPLDEATRESLAETHPNLPMLQDAAAMPLPNQEDEYDPDMDFNQPISTSTGLLRVPEAVMQADREIYGQELPIEPQIDSQLEQQIQHDIASADL